MVSIYIYGDTSLSSRTRRSSGSGDLGVELGSLRVLGGLAHRLDVGESVRRDGGEVNVGERVDEDRVGLSLGIACDTAGDLEVGVAAK